MLGYRSLGNVCMMGKHREWAQGVCALVQLWSVCFYSFFNLKLLSSCTTANETAMQVFFFIPSENILFNEGFCVQLLHDAQDNAEIAGLLNGQWFTFLFLPYQLWLCAHRLTTDITF